jgi:hypothetical protein
VEQPHHVEPGARPAPRRIAVPAQETRYPRGEEAALVQAALALGGVVLIAWDREGIPAIAQAIP